MRLRDTELRYLPVALTGAALFLWWLLYTGPAYAQDCHDATPPGPIYRYIECEFSWPSKYVPSAATWKYPATVIFNATDKKMILGARFRGFDGSQTLSPNWDGGAPGYMIVNGVTDHYPNLTAWQSIYPGTFTSMGLVWHGENAAAERTAGMFDYVEANFYDAVDWGAGVWLSGASEGGCTGPFRVMLMPDKWSQRVSVVRSDVPCTLPFSLGPQIGFYWWHTNIRNSIDPFDWHRANIEEQYAKFKNVYWRLNGESNDPSGIGFDLRVFPDVCDKHKIACFGTWSDCATHSPSCKRYNLPWFDDYSGPDMQSRLDAVLPVFTHSSANWLGDAGHYNLGLEWKNAGFIDTPDSLTVPIRYRAFKNLGEGIPDQPDTVTFNLTLRHPQAFTLRKGALMQYTIGDTIGYAVAQDGEVTLYGLTLDSSDIYTDVIVTETGITGC